MSAGTLLRDESAHGQGGVWAYVSPSRLNCWLACPLKFKLQYLDGLRPPTHANLFLGKAVHAGLEVLYRHRHLGLVCETADLTRRILEGWATLIDEENMRFSSPDEELALQRQAVELVAAYLGCAPADERPLAVEVAVEAPLVDPATGESLGIPLLGVMDLVLDAPAGPVIADFKTASRASEPLEIVHEVQLTSYAWLFRQASPRPESGLEIRSLIKTKTPKIEFHRYPARTEGHFGRLFAVIRAYLDALEAGRFVYRPGLHCAYCDFRETHCRHWSG